MAKQIFYLLLIIVQWDLLFLQLWAAQLANPILRPIVIVGDGAFQMTGMEISTISQVCSKSNYYCLK